jgi:GNAT superfamily N-acetyltransferase
MQFSDLALSKRLERTEGFSCTQYAEARRRLFPASGAEWMCCAGAYVAFDGPESPITQTFGLGLFEELTPSALDRIEGFFRERGAPVHHEVSPFAGPATLALLCERGYRPLELTSVLYRTLEHTPEQPAAAEPGKVAVRLIAPEEAGLWSEISAKGWSHEHPEYFEFLLELGRVSAACEHMRCFIASYDGLPGAAGALCIHEGVALFGGASTVPELRCRGLQAALLQARMAFAHEHGCELAMMVAELGSNSQRNAERKGLRVAYTRTKWKLFDK